MAVNSGVKKTDKNKTPRNPTRESRPPYATRIQNPRYTKIKMNDILLKN